MVQDVSFPFIELMPELNLTKALRLLKKIKVH